jgi:hypothetical protein
MANDYTYTDSLSTSGDSISYQYYDANKDTWIKIDCLKSEKEENMRSLFRITVVEPKTEQAFDCGLVVAKDRENALLKAGLSGAILANPDDYDIIVEHVGDVRAKKDIQEVRVVEGKDD